MSIETEKSFRIPVELEETPLPPLPPTRIEEITGEYLLNNSTGIYNYMNNISPLNLFTYIAIVLGIILIFTRLTIKINHVVGLAFGLALVYYLNERSQTINVDDLTKIEIQMESIMPKPKYFYMDANLIELVYNLMEFHNHNPEDFEAMVHAVDNVLKLRLDIERGMKECALIYDVAEDQKNNALNRLSAILVSIPSQQVLKEKLIAGIKILQLYLLRHLDFIKQRCIDQDRENGISTETKYITNSLTKPDKTILEDKFYMY